MNSKLIILVKSHCQTILAIIDGVGKADNKQSVDKSTFLKELSSLQTAALQIVINQLDEAESTERQTDDELVNKNTNRGGDELINAFELSRDEFGNKNFMDCKSDSNDDDDKCAFNRSSSENTNMNDVIQKMQDSVNAMKNLSLGNIEYFDDVDLDTDMAEISLADGTMNNVLNIQTVEAGGEANEPIRKRKLGTDFSIDGEVHSKQSHRDNEHANVTTVNDEGNSSTQYRVEDNGKYAYEHEEYPLDNVVPTISTEMAERLRLQNERFIKFGENKIKGICYFCEEDKVTQRSTWERHILMHTGERPFACEGCGKSFARETDHDNRMCSNTAINIFLENSSDGSLIGYCCKECNYLQIERKRMIAHLMNEHGEKCHYEKLTLVPAITRNNFQPATANLSMVLAQDTTNSNSRKCKSIAFTLPNERDDNELIRDTVQDHRNINPNIYCNSQTKCLLCDTMSTLSVHYKRSHFESEYHFARPSPEMAAKLRSQVEQFSVNENGKIEGLCYFCNEIKKFPRSGWRSHILRHTAEAGYSCEHCSMEVKYKHQHQINPIHNNLFKNGCKGNLIDVCEVNSTDDSFVGYMCQDCNYIQFKHERIIKHLKIEHGYHSSDIRHHYGKFTLVSNSCN